MTPFLPDFEKKTASQVIGDAVATVAAVRDAIGYDIDLGLEIHRNLRPEEAIVLAHEMLPFRILYCEDPLAPQSLEAMEYIARTIPLPMATGERFYNIFQFKDLIDRKIVSLIRPDLSLAGGFTQVRKVAAIAEAAFVGIFPHLMGSPVNIAAFCQLDASIPNYMLMENNTGADVFNEIVDFPVERQGGYFLLSQRPGIGLAIDESKLSRLSLPAKEDHRQLSRRRIRGPLAQAARKKAHDKDANRQRSIGAKPAPTALTQSSACPACRTTISTTPFTMPATEYATFTLAMSRAQPTWPLGYALASGKAGVYVVVPGPGFLNRLPGEFGMGLPYSVRRKSSGPRSIGPFHFR